MQTKFTLSIKGITHYYTSQAEAEKMALWCGIPVANVKVVDLW